MTTPAIILEAQQPVFTNNRTGARKSILGDQTADSPALVPDMETVNDVDYYGVVIGATNLVTTVVSDWTIDQGTSITVTDLGGFEYEIDFDGATDSRISFAIPQTSNDQFGACQVRLTAGSVPGTLTSSYISFGFGATRQGGSFDLTSLFVGDDFTDADFTVPSGTFSDLVAIRGQAGTPFTIVVRIMRAVDDDDRAAAFADGSAAGATYDVDVLQATAPIIGTVGEIVQLYTPYSWNDDAAPTTNPRLFNLTGGPSAYSVLRVGSPLWQSASTNTVEGEVIADQASFAVNNWNGTTVFSEYRPGNSGSVGNTVAPGDNLVLGNVGSGLQPFHGRLCCLIYDRILTDNERTIIEVWLKFGIDIETNTPDIILEARQPLSSATVIRASGRNTIFGDETRELAPNELDLFERKAVFLAGSMQGERNLAAADLDEWDITTSGVSTLDRVDLGNGVWRITIYTGDVGFGAYNRIQFPGDPISAPGGAFTCDLKVISGNEDQVIAIKFAGGNPGDDPDAILEFRNDGQFHTIEGFPINNRNQIEIGGRGIQEGGTEATVVFELRSIRLVDNPIGHAGFPFASAQFATYEDDLITVAPQFLNSVGTVMMGLDAYKYSGQGPAILGNMLASVTPNNYTIRVTDDVTILGSGLTPAIATGGSVSDPKTDVVTGEWENVTNEFTAQFNAETILSDTDDITFRAGDYIVGNAAAGGGVFHGALSMLVWDRLLTESEKKIARDWLQTGTVEGLLTVALGVGVGIGVGLGMTPTGAIGAVNLIDDEAPANLLVDDEIPNNVLQTKG